MTGPLRLASDRALEAAATKLVPAGMLEFVVNSISDPVSVVDESTTYRFVNDAWCLLTRRTREQAIGRTTLEVFPRTASPERQHALRECIDRGTQPVVHGPGTDGSADGLVLETRFFPYTDPQAGWRGAVVVTRDVTGAAADRAALSASLENLRLTLNTTGDAIFATDANDLHEPILFANDQMLRMWGIPADLAGRITGTTIIDHARPLFVDPEREIARIAEVIASGHEQEDRLVLRDGRVLLRRCVPTERDGRTLRVWGFRDITAEALAGQRLRDSERRLRTLLDALPGYITVLDHELNYLYVNDRVAEALGRSAAELVGCNATEVLDLARIDELRAAVRRALAGETTTIDRRIWGRDDRPPIDILVTLARGEGPDGRPVVYTFGADVTPLKRTQAALTAARDEAERANRAKSQFLSNMSHELRTPLNAVLGFTQVLQLDPTGNLNRDQLRQLGEIERAGGHLLALIDDLLDLTRIEAGRIEIELTPVALEPLIDECLRLLQPQAQAQEVRVEPPLFVPTRRASADARRLKQVLLNLLSNAVKYNHRGGRVTLACRLQEDTLRIEVRDTGPGLDAWQIAHLFRPFERLGAQRGAIQGTGIGLALSRQLVELMGGQIGVDSQPGQGCCFWVLLPAPAPAGPG